MENGGKTLEVSYEVNDVYDAKMQHVRREQKAEMEWSVLHSSQHGGTKV